MNATIISILESTPTSKILSEINKILGVKLPHKGAGLGPIVLTPEGCWRALILPSWVKGEKTIRFSCSNDGEFISF